jgi:glutaryl-CoA dehydrogenase
MTDLAHDYLDLDGLFSPDELALRDRVRAFVDERVRPNIADWYATATFPRPLVKEMAALGLLGMHLRGHGAGSRAWRRAT